MIAPLNPVKRLIEAVEHLLMGDQPWNDKEAYRNLVKSYAALQNYEPSTDEIQAMADWLVRQPNTGSLYHDMARAVLKWAAGKKEDQ